MAADLPPDERPRCTATSVMTGERCKRRPSPGSTVCTKHGAGAPQVKAKALARVQRAEAMRLAERLGIEGSLSSDPVEAIEQALIIAQGYLIALGDHADWRLRMEALDRVASIATAMLRLKLLGQGGNGDSAAAEQLAREHLGRLAGSLYASCRSAIYVAADGNAELAGRALAQLEDDMRNLHLEAT